MKPLKDMTWNHPRGYDAMVAVSAAWEQAGGRAVHWDKRSLQDFESYPVEKLAREYDLIVIDHPHVGQITAEGCLLPLPDAPEIARASVGPSYPSYRWQGQQWAYPIDAASQVQATRPDLIAGPALSWDQVLDLAKSGRVAIPLRAPHALMSFFTLIANAGHPCRNEGRGALIDREAGIVALERLAALVALVDPACFDWDPIDVLERMAYGDDIACAPLIYGYVSYSRQGAAGKHLSLHNIPETSPGAGVTGSEVQRGLYAASGGQVGHARAWHDAAVDQAANGFYSGTARTLDSVLLRPRHDGYMSFQDAASQRISQALRDGNFVAAIDDMEGYFAAIFAPA